MRVEVRRIVNLDQANLRDLSPMEKIELAIRDRWHKSKRYTVQKEKEDNEQNLKKIEKEDRLTEKIIIWLMRELINNRTGKSYDKEVIEITLVIDSEFGDCLADVLKRGEFISYDIKIVEEDNDLRLAFPHMPILINCRKRVVSSDKEVTYEKIME